MRGGDGDGAIGGFVVRLAAGVVVSSTLMELFLSGPGVRSDLVRLRLGSAPSRSFSIVLVSTDITHLGDIRDASRSVGSAVVDPAASRWIAASAAFARAVAWFMVCLAQSSLWCWTCLGPLVPVTTWGAGIACASAVPSIGCVEAWATKGSAVFVPPAARMGPASVAWRAGGFGVTGNPSAVRIAPWTSSGCTLVDVARGVMVEQCPAITIGSVGLRVLQK